MKISLYSVPFVTKLATLHLPALLRNHQIWGWQVKHTPKLQQKVRQN